MASNKVNDDGKSTAELTVDYIKEHPHILSCLKRDLINYSSLARLISKDLGIGKKSSIEAILVAARRYQEKLKNDKGNQQKIKTLLKNSEIEIKNKIDVFVLEKNINQERLEKMQNKIHKDSGTMYLLEGSNRFTFITQHKYGKIVEKTFKNRIVKRTENLVLVMLKSPKEIETTTGVVSFLTSLFSENGVNIHEFLSCWTDTLFVIAQKDLNKTIDFLDF